MKRKHAMLGLLMVLLGAPSACVSHYSKGPPFVAVSATPPGYGMVYVYRPARSWGAAYIFSVEWQSRHFSLVSGSYCAFLLPEGPQTLQGSAPFTVDVRNDAPKFVKIEFDERDHPAKQLVMRPEEALREMGSVHLGAGGGARWPIPPVPNTSPTKPSTTSSTSP